MTHDTLAIAWFGIWGLIWCIYFMLDAYALGTGMLFPFLAKTEQEQKQLQEAIGPFWGGNEVWLITAGGATFAAFPNVYALMFSYLYTPLYLILFALFFRAIGLEFIHKHDSARWKAFWKWSFFAGSLTIALLFGVAFANLYRGLFFDDAGYHGNLLSLLKQYGIVGGITFISLFLLSGSIWISYKTLGDVRERALRFARSYWGVALTAFAIFMVATGNETTLFTNAQEKAWLWCLPFLTLVSLLLVGMFLKRNKIGASFAAICCAIFTFMATGFAGMFPNLLISRMDETYNLTLYNARGSQLNLTIMFYLALFIVPIVIVYQTWLYRIFRDKITTDNAQGYH